MNAIYRTIAPPAMPAICFLAGSLAGRRMPYKGEAVFTADTLTLRDTLHIPYLLSVDVTIAEDEIKVPIEDIIITNDSLAVLPMEVKRYEGEGYKAQVSGYRPRLDWIEIFPRTTVITKTQRLVDNTRNGILLSAQMMYSDRFCTATSVIYEHNWKRISANAGVGYDFVRRQFIVTAGLQVPLAKW